MCNSAQTLKTTHHPKALFFCYGESKYISNDNMENKQFNRESLNYSKSTKSIIRKANTSSLYDSLVDLWFWTNLSLINNPMQGNWNVYHTVLPHSQENSHVVENTLFLKLRTYQLLSPLKTDTLYSSQSYKEKNLCQKT